MLIRVSGNISHQHRVFFIEYQYLENQYYAFIWPTDNLYVYDVLSLNMMCLLLLTTVGEFLTQYGWYLLVVTVLVYLLIQNLNKRRSSQRARGSPPPSQQGQHQLLNTCLYA